jgi:TRAP-type uncharacterized transport system fused permease subunit
MFALGPGLLLQGPVLGIIEAIVSAFVGIFCLTSAVQGWMFTRMKPVNRLMTGAAALGFLYPSLLYSILGVLLLALAATLQWKIRKSEFIAQTV